MGRCPARTAFNDGKLYTRGPDTAYTKSLDNAGCRIIRSLDIELDNDLEKYEPGFVPKWTRIARKRIILTDEQVDTLILEYPEEL